MKEIIFAHLKGFLVEGWGREADERFLERSASLPAEPSPGTPTPDPRTRSMVSAACEETGLEPEEALRAFGRHSLASLDRLYPMYFAGLTDPMDFLLSMNRALQAELRKEGARESLPEFRFINAGPRRLRIEYRSRHRLCHLMEGLLDGLSARFPTPIRHAHTACLHAGDACCVFEIEGGKPAVLESLAAIAGSPSSEAAHA